MIFLVVFLVAGIYFPMSKNYFYIFSLVVALGLGGIYGFISHENSLGLTRAEQFSPLKGYGYERDADEIKKSPAHFQKTVALPAEKIAPSSQELKTLAGTPSEAEVVRKWEESRGRFDEESLKDYAGYDLDTLKSLAENGDVKAMIALARLYVSEQYAGEYGVKYSMPLLKVAAIHGSSYAMELYAIQYEAEYFVNGTSDRNVLLETLSWNNAAALRGDVYPNNSATLDLRRKNIQLNAEEIQSVRNRSEEIYQQLLSERRSMGLGDFDNSVPVEVQKYFAYLETYIGSKK